MKKVSVILILMLSSVFFNTINAQYKVTVRVVNLNSNKGQVVVNMYDKENFMKKPLFVKTNTRLMDGQSLVVFENVPSGEYSFNCFHDINKNGKMDLGSKESSGLSNGKRPDLSDTPPVFGDGKVTIDVDKVITIYL